MSEYHGIVIDISLDDPAVLASLEEIGRQTLADGALALVKVRVADGQLDTAITDVQTHLKRSAPGFEQGFYAHFYTDAELIVVFKDRVFRQTPDRATWGELVAYGRSLGIAEQQLDFFPCRFADETY